MLLEIRVQELHARVMTHGTSILKHRSRTVRALNQRQSERRPFVSMDATYTAFRIMLVGIAMMLLSVLVWQLWERIRVSVAAFFRAWYGPTVVPVPPPANTDCPFDDPMLCEKWAEVTDRQRQAVILAGQGHTVRQIADVMSIEESTVKTHVKNVREKLGLSDKKEIKAYIRKPNQ